MTGQIIINDCTVYALCFVLRKTKTKHIKIKTIIFIMKWYTDLFIGALICEDWQSCYI